MIEILQQNEILLIRADNGDFAPRNESQLSFWQFEYSQSYSAHIFHGTEISLIIPKLIAYLEKEKLAYQLSDGLKHVVRMQEDESRELNGAKRSGRDFKEGVFDSDEAKEFSSFLKTNISRPLKDHQFKAALHLLSSRNGANFSVPGSGKTSVVLSVFQKLRFQGEVDALFVVGPPACFRPWQDEFKSVMGRGPDFEILAGGNIDDRRSKYLVNSSNVADLYLTTFQTLSRDWEQVRVLFEQQGIKFFLVVDEAH